MYLKTVRTVLIDFLISGRYRNCHPYIANPWWWHGLLEMMSYQHFTLIISTVCGDIQVIHSTCGSPIIRTYRPALASVRLDAFLVKCPVFIIFLLLPKLCEFSLPWPVYQPFFWILDCGPAPLPLTKLSGLTEFGWKEENLRLPQWQLCCVCSFPEVMDFVVLRPQAASTRETFILLSSLVLSCLSSNVASTCPLLFGRSMTCHLWFIILPWAQIILTSVKPVFFGVKITQVSHDQI